MPYALCPIVPHVTEKDYTLPTLPKYCLATYPSFVTLRIKEVRNKPD